jgi:HPt (histidine-containing phosphotransfer) domain-containing protein
MNQEYFVFNTKLDGEFLRSIYEDDKEHAEMVFEQFLLSIGMQLAEIEDSYTTGNTEFFRKKIHKLKPVLSFVGLTGLTGKAEILEKKCSEASDITNLSELYTGFKNELKEMIPIVEGDLEKLRAN